MIYLDYAAATPINDWVWEQMSLARENFANPTSLYSAGRKSRDGIAQATDQIAKFLNVRTDEIIVTSGSTESNNLAILGALGHKVMRKHAVALATEHVSVIEPLRKLRDAGMKLTLLPVRDDGSIDLIKLEQSILDSTTLICAGLVTSETGVITPIAKIAQIVNKIRKDRQARGVLTPLYLHSDASAAAWILPLHLDRLGVDLLTLGSSKCYGPHNVGILFVKRGTVLEPQIFGGAQQKGLRAGTQDVVGLVGLAAALKLVGDNRVRDEMHCQKLKQLLLVKIQKEFDNVVVHGITKYTVSSIVNFSIAPYPADTIVSYLDTVGIAVGTGAACAASDKKPSPALLAMGISETEAHSSLRVSFGRSTTEDEIKEFVSQLSRIISKLATMKL